MSFWLGVFAGLAVWKFVNLFFSVLFYGSTMTIDREHLLIDFITMAMFMFLAWYQVVLA